MLTTCSGWSDDTRNRHWPVPAPSRPVMPLSPASSCCAVRVLAPPPASVSVTSPPVAAAPPSSRAPIVTAAGAAPGLISRSRLTRTISVDGLKTGTSQAYRPEPSADAARTVSCIAPSVPSAARTNARGTILRSVSISRRTSPTSAPMPPASPREALPDCRSVAVNCAAAEAFNVKVAGPVRVPASSTAWISTVPDSSVPLRIRSTPCGPPGVPGGTSNGTV